MNVFLKVYFTLFSKQLIKVWRVGQVANGSHARFAIDHLLTNLQTKRKIADQGAYVYFNYQLHYQTTSDNTIQNTFYIFTMKMYTLFESLQPYYIFTLTKS